MTLSLIVFIIGLPIFLLSVIAFRWTAELDRRNAALLLGRAAARHLPATTSGESFLARLGSTSARRADLEGPRLARRPLGARLRLRRGRGVRWSPRWSAFLTMPLWFWSISGGVDWGGWNIDNLPLALLATVARLPARGAHRPSSTAWMAMGELWLARMAPRRRGGARRRRLGGGRTEHPAARPTRCAGSSRPANSRWPSTRRLRPARPLRHRDLGWRPAAATTGPPGSGSRLLIPLSLHFGLREAVRLAPERRGLAIQAAVSLVIIGVTIAVWALTGFGTFWPIWTILGLIVLFVLVLLVRSPGVSSTATSANAS